MTRTGIGLSGDSIHIRMTKEQKDLIRKVAKYEGLELSSWVRRVSLERARELINKGKKR